jgi:hypothetical protein
MCDFSDNCVDNITLISLHLPNNDLEKYTMIQDIDNKPKLYKLVKELWLCEKEKEKLFFNIENDPKLYEKVKGFLDGKNNNNKNMPEEIPL